MGQATIQDRRGRNRAVAPDQPSGDVADADVVAGTLRAEASVSGLRNGQELAAGGSSKSGSPAQRQGEPASVSECAENDGEQDPAPKPASKREHMRRILARVDQTRLAVRQLNACVLDAVDDGIDRDVIIAAIHASTEDWSEQYRRMCAVADLLQAAASDVSLDMIRLDNRPISSKAARRDAAYEDGGMAELRGVSLMSCPYTKDQPEMRKAWRDGWNNARRNA